MRKESVQELFADERDIVVFIGGEAALNVIQSSGKIKNPTVEPISLLRGRVGVDSVRPRGDVSKGNRSLDGHFLSLKQVGAFIT